MYRPSKEAKIMSDVERIVNTNAERVQWALEVERMAQENRKAAPKAPAQKKRDNERFRAIRSAAFACAMFSGAGAAFVGIGLAADQLLTVGAGALIMLVFLRVGAQLERYARSV